MDELSSASAVGGAIAAATAFGLIFLAEIGDKSQLVCMTLAACHHHRPVLAGAIAAFAVLNILAVVFGTAVAHWVPEPILAAAIAILFAVFGVLSLQNNAGDETEELRKLRERSTHGVFATTFLILFLAEMGDKTQLAVAGMAGTLPPVPVWIGATLALITTSALGIIIGRKLLRRIPVRRLHRISGVFFLLIAAFAVTRIF